METHEETQQYQSLPKIKHANVILMSNDSDGDKRGIYIGKEEAERIFVDLDVGIIRANSVFRTKVEVMDSDGNERKVCMFINMINVENIVFEYEEE